MCDPHMAQAAQQRTKCCSSALYCTFGAPTCTCGLRCYRHLTDRLVAIRPLYPVYFTVVREKNNQGRAAQHPHKQKTLARAVRLLPAHEYGRAALRPVADQKRLRSVRDRPLNVWRQNHHVKDKMRMCVTRQRKMSIFTHGSRQQRTRAIDDSRNAHGLKRKNRHQNPPFLHCSQEARNSTRLLTDAERSLPLPSCVHVPTTGLIVLIVSTLVLSGNTLA